MNTVATITDKGQITIPKFIRDLLSLAPADSLIFGVESGKILATPVRKRDFLSLYGSVKHRGGPIDFKKLRQKTIRALAKNAAQEGLK